MAMGTARQPHNEVCRERAMQSLKSEAKTKNAERRKREVIENEEEMEKKENKSDEPDVPEARAGGSEDYLETHAMKKKEEENAGGSKGEGMTSKGWSKRGW